jgi:hypothetical protein
MDSTTKSLLVVIVLQSLAVAACGPTERCAIERAEASEEVTIRCAGEEPIVTEGEVDGPCRKTPGRVECEDGRSFEFDDAEAADEGERDGAASDVGTQENEAFGGGAVGEYRADCQRVGEDVICEDGVQGTVPEGVEDDTDCRSEMVVGVGRRIVCDGRRSRPVGAEDISCEYLEEEETRAVACSDGTIVAGDAVPAEACSPTIERKGDDVVVVECGAMSVELALGPCNRDWTLKTASDVQELASSGCTSIHGDVFVEPICEVEAGVGETKVKCEGEDVFEFEGLVEGPCSRVEEFLECADGSVFDVGEESQMEGIWHLETFGEVDYIGGSLFIEEQPALESIQLDEIVGVGGSVVVRKNERLRMLEGFESLEWVTGNWVLSENDELEAWVPPRKLTYVDDTFVLSSNPKLEAIGEIEGGFISWSMPRKLDVGGAAVLTDNDALDWCVVVELGAWLGAKAGAKRVYLGGEPASNVRSCPPIDWVR